MRAFFARGHDVGATLEDSRELLVGLIGVSRVLLLVLELRSPREDLARPSLEFAPLVPAKTAQDWAQVDWSTRPQKLLPVRLAEQPNDHTATTPHFLDRAHARQTEFAMFPEILIGELPDVLGARARQDL